MENSRDKFVRLAENRVNNLIKHVRLIGNLSNTSNYTYTEKDVELIFSTINAELKAARERFKANKFDTSEKFKLYK